MTDTHTGKKNRVIARVAGGILLLMVGAGLGVYAATSHLGDRVYREQLVNEARSIADMTENVGAWAATYKGVWIKDDGLTQAGVDVGSHIDTKRYRADQAPADQAQEILDTYHRKNPALVQRELADVIQKSDSRSKFRLTSDKYMNPMNAPDGFDQRAIQSLRASQAPEYFEVRGNELRYARRVEAQANCMSCHDTPEKAPKTVALMYPGPQGYGYVVGELAGIISVRVPYTYSAAKVFKDL